MAGKHIGFEAAAAKAAKGAGVSMDRGRAIIAAAARKASPAAKRKNPRLKRVKMGHDSMTEELRHRMKG